MQQYLVENKTPDDYVRVADKWSSFYEYSKNIKTKLEDHVTRANYDIREQDIGTIQAAAFNIIKLRDYSEIDSRNHEIIRKFFKWIEVDKNEFGMGKETKKGGDLFPYFLCFFKIFFELSGVLFKLTDVTLNFLLCLTSFICCS
jgi:hypothetical protein